MGEPPQECEHGRACPTTHLSCGVGMSEREGCSPISPLPLVTCSRLECWHQGHESGRAASAPHWLPTGESRPYISPGNKSKVGPGSVRAGELKGHESRTAPSCLAVLQGWPGGEGEGKLVD